MLVPLKKKKKIFILDSSGMAGHVISQYLADGNHYELLNIACDVNTPKDIVINVEDIGLLDGLINEYQPDIIINCLRVLIEESENDHARAIYCNSFIPHHLSKISKKNGAKVIQLSTDCVFSGRKGNYNEADVKDGDTYYAKTKALGELINDQDLTSRTSYIGPNLHDKNEELFHWFMSQKGDVFGYTKALWTGITTLELAKRIEEAIELNLTGVYHLVPDHKISKYDLLALIQNIWKIDNVFLKKNENINIDKSLIDNRKKIKVNHYRLMFEELYDWMQTHKTQYMHYFDGK